MTNGLFVQAERRVRRREEREAQSRTPGKEEDLSRSIRGLLRNINVSGASGNEGELPIPYSHSLLYTDFGVMGDADGEMVGLTRATAPS